MYALLTCW